MYSVTMHILCGLLFVGFLCNMLMHSVSERHHHVEADAAALAAGSSKTR